MVAGEGENGTATVSLATEDADGITLAERFYAVVVPFDTVQDDVTLEELKARWAGEGDGPLYVTCGFGDAECDLRRGQRRRGRGGGIARRRCRATARRSG